jgi:hypothetical protein
MTKKGVVFKKATMIDKIGLGGGCHWCTGGGFSIFNWS